MNSIQTLLIDQLDLWTTALLTKSTAGRGSNGKLEAYGIKKLRTLILELAITGRLIGNDTSGWTEALLGEIGEWGSGGTPLKAHSEYYGGDIPWLVIGDLNDGLVTEAQSYITQLGLEKSSAQLVPEGTLLIAMYGSIGKLGIAGIPCATNQAIAFCNPDSEQIETQYLFLYLRAIREHLLSRGQGLAQQNISQKILKATSIKLPSLEEQHRIVAKVDELMAMCDQLEQQQTLSIAAHQTLVASLLGTLTRDASQQEFSAAWARISSHFDTLFTTEASIDQLKQTILQLAVMGKLVPQDPNDEPASVLLERIEQQKVRLVDAGEIRKQKPLSNIEDEEKLFELPIGWKWCRLHEIVYLLGDGLHGTPEYTLNEKFYFVNGNNLNDGQIVIKSETKTVARDQYDKYKKPLGENSVLVSINGTLGNVAFYNNEAIILGKSACFFNLAEEIYKRFIKVVIDAPSFVDYSYKNATGSTIKNLGLSAMNSLPIALPPKEEQHRIVAKIDELMALCDTLKAHLADAQAIQLHLADAIVEQAVC